MADYAIISKNLLTQIGNAIRKMRGKSDAELIPSINMPTEIESIKTGVDVSNVDATVNDVLLGKTFVDSTGTEVKGTIITRNSDNLLASGGTVTVPAGYYASEAKKSVSTATQATPSISISSSGVITASATQSAGYVSGGTKSATKQLSTKSATTYTPSTSDQTISSGCYLTGTQTISGDSNLKVENIKYGVSIFGITGSYTGGSVITESPTLNMSTQNYMDITTDDTIGTLCGFCLAFESGDGHYALVSYNNGSALYMTYINEGTATCSIDTTTVSFDDDRVQIRHSANFKYAGFTYRDLIDGYISYIPA